MLTKDNKHDNIPIPNEKDNFFKKKIGCIKITKIFKQVVLSIMTNLLLFYLAYKL